VAPKEENMLLELVRETRNDVKSLIDKIDGHSDRIRDVEAVQDAHAQKLEEIEERSKTVKNLVFAAVGAAIVSCVSAVAKWFTFTPPTGSQP